MTTADRGDGYVDDVPYLRQLVTELGPQRIRVVAAINGAPPPPAEDFDYCELGCGHGDTIAALAAAHPESRFLGVDLVAAHVGSARRLARDGALENVGFLERDFEALLAEDIGEFDYVVAHGVLTWVSPEKRHALIEFARAKLKPGGLLYVGYNAMPGWSAVEPLRQLLLSPLDAAPASSVDDEGLHRSRSVSLERARRGVAFAQAMEQSGAGYFARNPAASEMLATMLKAGLPYVVHEYLHEHWTPMYFARVAWEMAAADLHFAGVLPLALNFPETAVPPPMAKLLAPATDRLVFESLKDFALNTTFRNDVYVRGKTARSTAVTDAFLEATSWGTFANAPPPELPEGPIFEALLAALAKGAAPLAGRAELAPFDEAERRRALLRLIVAEHAVPSRRPTRAVAPPADVRLHVPSPYNQMMLRRLSSEVPTVLVSPIAGAAFPLAAMDGLAIRVLTEAPPDGRARWIHDLVARSVLRIAEAGRVIADPVEQERFIGERVEQVRTTRLAKLVELGVLAVRENP